MTWACGCAYTVICCCDELIACYWDCPAAPCGPLPAPRQTPPFSLGLCAEPSGAAPPLAAVEKLFLGRRIFCALWCLASRIWATTTWSLVKEENCDDAAAYDCSPPALN